MKCCSSSVERRRSNTATSHLQDIFFSTRHTCLEKVRRLNKVQRIAPPVKWEVQQGGGSVMSFEGPPLSLWVTYFLGPRWWVCLRGTQGHFVVRTCLLNSGTKQLDQGRGKAIVQPVRHITVTRTQLVGGVDTCEGACYPNLEEVPHTHTNRHTHTHTQSYSLMMLPETSVRTCCKKEHFAAEVDLNRF